jgi:hypothetical protein
MHVVAVGSDYEGGRACLPRGASLLGWLREPLSPGQLTSPQCVLCVFELYDLRGAEGVFVRFSAGWIIRLFRLFRIH